MHVTKAATTQQAAVVRSASLWSARSATRIVVSTFGAFVAFAGIEHGVGAILQGPVAPSGLVIESWPDAKAFELMAGEPAMTVIPNLLATGVLAVTVALALGIWSVMYVERRHGSLALIALSILLLLVGGGFAPPLMGIILGIAAARIGAMSRRPPGGIARALAPIWRLALVVGLLGYLTLFPGLVVGSYLFGVDDHTLVVGLGALSFASLLLALVAARAADRVRAA